jgi:eukaryotic-like serine/threonine-protein kinase
MPSQHWENLQEIFHAAVALAPEVRSAYLDRACDGDASLRLAVESLIHAHEETGFVDQPAYQAAADLLIQDGRLIAGQTVGRYRIVSLIGEGGMGRVYLAEDTKLHRKVSLKFLSTIVTQDHQRLRRFEQEARAASALNHPNIITIHEIAEEEGHQFIATEYIEGRTLRECLSSPLDLDELLEIAIQVASALVAAHRVKIVHRDIKPENIMIRNEDGLVKVLDFGLAKITVSRHASIDAEADTQLRNTTPGTVMGTVAYMSPEQARGEPVDERTDIWSLGVVIYEMVAGCSPFVAATSNGIISTILSKQPVSPLARYAAGIPERLEEIVEKALTKNRDERYQTSKDLLIDLKRLQQTLQLKAAREHSASPDKIVPATNDGGANVAKSETAPAIVPSTSSAEYIVNQVKSHKRAALTGLGVLLLIATGIFIYTWRIRQTAAPTQPEIKSLAVLPLKSLDANDNYLGLGIADAVIRRISQTGELTVRPTSAVRRYLNEDTDALTAARHLNVDAVLEGSVQRVNDRLRVSINLLRSSDGASLWPDKFDIQSIDIFTIQDTVAQEVAARLRLQLDPAQQARLKKRSTVNANAYEYFLKGNYSFDKRELVATADLEVAEAMFKKAVEIDSQYALAHARLAYCYAWKALFTDVENPSWIEQAREETKRAEALDPELPQIAEVRYEITWSKYGDFDISAAVRELRRGQQFDPNSGHQPLGVLAYHLGFEDIAFKELQRATEIDPTSENIKVNLVEANELLGRYDEAINTEKKFFNDLGPALALIWANRLNDAETDITQSLAKEPSNVRMQSARVRLLALQGKFNEAEALIPAITAKAVNTRSYHHVTYDFACAYALAGKTREAVEWLRKTIDYGMPNYPLFERDPHLDHIRRYPSFVQFMQEFRPRWEEYRRGFM